MHILRGVHFFALLSTGTKPKSASSCPHVEIGPRNDEIAVGATIRVRFLRISERSGDLLEKKLSRGQRRGDQSAQEIRRTGVTNAHVTASSPSLYTSVFPSLVEPLKLPRNPATSTPEMGIPQRPV